MSTSIRHRARRIFIACANVESLERRTLLASVGIIGGSLTIIGNETGDTISVSPGAAGQTLVSINGATSSFGNATFNNILVNALGGNDSVTLANTITKPATLRGGAGNDSLVGGGGNDLLDGGTGSDTLKGGAGNDTADYSSCAENLHIGLGTLADDGAAGEKDNIWTDIETVLGGSGNDTLKGSDGNNLLVGNGGNDSIQANWGNDTLDGGAGNDSLYGEFGSDSILGGSGNDTIHGGDDSDFADAGAGDDFLIGGDGNDTLQGGDDHDTLQGGNGTDTLNGGAGSDTGVGDGDTLISIETTTGPFGEPYEITPDRTLLVKGTGNADDIEVFGNNGGVDIVVNGRSFLVDSDEFDRIRIEAGEGNDDIYTAVYDVLPIPVSVLGQGGNDTIQGGFAGEYLDGGAGNDSIVGNSGDDTLIGGAGSDTLKGGAGNDTVDYSSRTANLTIGLGTVADDGEAGEKDNVWYDIETVLGGSGNDLIKGHSNNNRLVGNAGNDTLMGNYGNDTLVGGPGTDLLNGEAGTDTGVDVAGDTIISIENTTGPGGDGSAVITPDRTLLVTGTEASDIIALHADADQPALRISIGVNTQNFSFLRSDFDRLWINALGHHDDVFIDELSLEQPLVIHAGDGNDAITLRTANAAVIGGAGDDSLRREDSSFESASFDGGSGVDFIHEVNFDPVSLDLRTMPTVENALIKVGVLLGNDLANELTVEASAFDMQGFGGNDTLYVGGDANYGESSVDGGAGDDLIEVNSDGGNLVQGGDGNDTLRGGGASSPDSGLDEFIGGAGDDLIDSSSLEAMLAGGDGNDTLLGSGGADVLHGGAGNDLLDGRDGDDTLNGDAGGDTLKGGAGNDTADYSGRSANLTIGLGTRSDDGEAGEGDNVWLDIETVLGGDGNDFIRGYSGNELLVGGFGNDTLMGHYGNDTLVGGPGTDTLNGESGTDTAQDIAGDVLISIENS